MRFKRRCLSQWAFAFAVLSWGGFTQTHSPERDEIADDRTGAEESLSQFEIHPQLTVGLFASEPTLVNPTNIDIDHEGRVWVCEAVNYRRFRNGDMPRREEGDRILVLEDTDGDGAADQSTTFYQDPLIDSPHGICVLGNRVIVSAGDSVWILSDNNGDLVADEKQLLFTGISGVQHDHGIHAFVFGPDGKLYFNFGNEGKQIRDRDGQPIVDLAGNVVEMRRPYQNGMIFRCELDGSQLETLAWNFRNNWEVCVDSYGRIWQSDNDDDGNRATRINYVLPYGNYGFSDELTGAGWRAPRTGQADSIPERHWHLNDPGVVPNLLQTGAGSPTGICVYEGERLPAGLQGQLLHCDAGPNVVRAYPVTPEGAGFTAEVVGVLDGSSRNQWFRPSDVCVAPDGSVFVSDWYDPGVGGHRMQDVGGGRIYRLTPRDGNVAYSIPDLDVSTIPGALAALGSPNQAARFMGWQALRDFEVAAVEPVLEKARSSDGTLRARALWWLGKNWPDDERVAEFLGAVASESSPIWRALTARIACQVPDSRSANAIWNSLKPGDPSPAVRRELLIAMRQPGGLEFKAETWAELAEGYSTNDRWYLEALGISAVGRWEECLTALQGRSRWNLASPRLRDIVWRSRSPQTASLLEKLILDPSVTAKETLRYFRALDFCPQDTVGSVVRRLAFETKIDDPQKSAVVVTESLTRVGAGDLSEAELRQLGELIVSLRESPFYVDLARKFSLETEYPRLLGLAIERQGQQLGVDAMRALFQLGQKALIRNRLLSLAEGVDSDYSTLLKAIASAGNRPAVDLLAELVLDPELSLQNRREAVSALGSFPPGALRLLDWAESDRIAGELQPAVVAALYNSRSEDVRDRARKRFPQAASEEGRPVPLIADLMRITGDAERGAALFTTERAQCSQCHVVRGNGKSVGPDLSEIGSKLTRAALFESLLHPSAGISHGYENWSVVTTEGQLLSGLILAETEEQIVIQDKEGIRRTLPTDEIDGRKLQTLSLMPDGLHRELGDQELADLVRYLENLRKP